MIIRMKSYSPVSLFCSKKLEIITKKLLKNLHILLKIFKFAQYFKYCKYKFYRHEYF